LGLVEKWKNWRDVSKRRNAVATAIASRNPDTVKNALANVRPEEADTELRSAWVRSAIDEQNLQSFKEVLRFVDDPNIDIEVNKGSGRYPDIHHLTPLAYALTEARTHDISLLLATNPRVTVADEYLEDAKSGGMQDVAAALASRVADNRRHEADLRQQEAAQLDQEAADGGVTKSTPAPAPEPGVVTAPAPADSGENGETWARMSETSVAHVTSSKIINRKMTEIFNFESKERTVITTNLETGVDTMNPVEKFETVPQAAVQRAGEMLKSLNDDEAAQKRATFKL
jgi:hypothetical protein